MAVPEKIEEVEEYLKEKGFEIIKRGNVLIARKGLNFTAKVIFDEKKEVKTLLMDYDDNRIRARIEITEGQGYSVSITNKREEEKLDIIWKANVDLLMVSDFITEFADDPYSAIEGTIDFIIHQFLDLALP
jgi:hypothetical protein